MERELDVVVFGATGDTGVVGCCCLFFRGRRLGVSSWAPAARSPEKLQRDVLDRLRGAEPGPEGLAPEAPIQADAGDYASLLRMCRRAKCVVACAGPFADYGEGVVRACVEAGTHYVDVTGEVPWVEKMLRRYGEEASRKGVSIVSCAGYDSVPPDLATFLAAKALEKEGQSLQRFEAFVGGGGGAMPTGTLNTVVKGVDEAKRQVLSAVTFGALGQRPPSPSLSLPPPQRAAAAAAAPSDETSESEPLLRPATEAKRVKYVPASEQGNLSRNLLWTMLPGYSSLAGQFCLPHFMAPINVNVVHRTAATEGYGGLEYRERMGGLPKGLASLYGLVPSMMGVGASLLLAVTLPLPYFSTMVLKLRDTLNTPLQQRVRDLVFEGFRSTGKTTLQGFGVSQTGRTTVQVKLRSEYDPGLGFTMLSACTVAAQVVRKAGTAEPSRPGFHTAVSAVGGAALASALQDMGVHIDVSTQHSSRL